VGDKSATLLDLQTCLADFYSKEIFSAVKDEWGKKIGKKWQYPGR